MEMIVLNVGSKYPLPLAPNFEKNREGAATQFLTNTGNILQIALKNMHEEELASLSGGNIKAGFVYKNGNILWLFQFYRLNKPKEVILEFDSFFDARLLDRKELVFNDIANNGQRLVIDIHIVDENKIIRGLRKTTMSNELTASFLSSVQDQLASVPDPESCVELMNHSISSLISQTKSEILG